MRQNQNENLDIASKTVRIIKSYPGNAVAKEMQAAPEKVRLRFGANLTLLSNNMETTCTVSPLKSLGANVYELKENGRPAWLVRVLHGCQRRYLRVVRRREDNKRGRQAVDVNRGTAGKGFGDSDQSWRRVAGGKIERGRAIYLKGDASQRRLFYVHRQRLLPIVWVEIDIQLVTYAHQHFDQSVDRKLF